MNFITEYNTYLSTLMANIEGINKFKMVDNETDVTQFIRDQSSLDNSLMMGVMPTSGNNSPTDADAFMNRYYTEIMVVNKVDVSVQDQETYVNTFNETHELALKIQQHLLDSSVNGTCTLFKHMIASSIQIVTVNLSQVKGWNIIFSFDIPQ